MDDIRQHLIEWKLNKLNFAFFRHLDRREYDDAAQLITPDGIIHFTGGVTRGRAAFCDYTRQWPDLTVRHVVSNLLYSELTEDSARGEGLLAVFVGPGQTGDAPVPRHPSEPHLAEVQDLYRLTDEGWRIAERRFKNLLLPAHS
jgi:hypothetical protein